MVDQKKGPIIIKSEHKTTKIMCDVCKHERIIESDSLVKKSQVQKQLDEFESRHKKCK